MVNFMDLTTAIITVIMSTFSIMYAEKESFRLKLILVFKLVYYVQVYYFQITQIINVKH